MSRTEELYRRLLGLTRKGEAHTPLPSYKELTAHYGANIVVLREALARLEAEGRIYRRPRRGCFIAPPRHDRVVLLVHNVRYDRAGDEITDYGYEHLLYSISQAASGPGSRYAVIPVLLPEYLASLADLPLVYPGLCGIVFHATKAITEPMLERSLVHGVPVVYTGSDAWLSQMSPSVSKSVVRLCWRETDIANTMARHLAEHGHTRLGIIEKRHHLYPDDRIRHMREVMSITKSYMALESPEDEETRFRSFARGLTAVCAPNDFIAITAMNLAVRLGYRVPGQLSFVGFENNKFCNFSVCPLDSIEQPLARAGRGCIRALESDGNARPARARMKLRVVKRGSVAKR
jgi:hypothetical protein